MQHATAELGAAVAQAKQSDDAVHDEASPETCPGAPPELLDWHAPMNKTTITPQATSNAIRIGSIVAPGATKPPS